MSAAPKPGTAPPAPPAPAGSRARAPGPPRFGYALLLRRLLELRAAVDADPAASPDAMDRRQVLARLQAELGATPELLLARGFDRAYRRAVEGV